MYVFATYFPVFTLLEPPLTQLAYVFVGIGLMFDFSSLVLFVLSKTTPNPLKPANASQLVIRGFYQYTRNPMYVGLFFLLLAWAWHLAVLTPFLALPLFVWIITLQQIQPEEQALEEKFGESYRAYKAKVRRWI
ncbi:MAG: isoprenylcysteine carboxylmethyltransferase family protein [Thiotrichaceae bacterium]|nr:isoprenylcysteine carboxylmethyltransferase family protein [Thiotrichaceae bacterium]